MERKDSIRRFLKEQFRDDKKSKENNVVTVTAGSSAMATPSSHSDSSSKGSNTETKPKSSGYRLFRTVSNYRITIYNIAELIPGLMSYKYFLQN